MKKHRLDKQLIVELGIEALVFAIGILFVILVFCRVDIKSSNYGLIAAIYSVISMVLWTFLLFRSC